MTVGSWRLTSANGPWRRDAVCLCRGVGQAAERWDGVEQGWWLGQVQGAEDLLLGGRRPQAKVIVLGDINDFEFSQTVQLLEGGC
jgi:hypothetical protein